MHITNDFFTLARVTNCLLQVQKFGVLFKQRNIADGQTIDQIEQDERSENKDEKEKLLWNGVERVRIDGVFAGQHL